MQAVDEAVRPRPAGRGRPRATRGRWRSRTRWCAPPLHDALGPARRTALHLAAAAARRRRGRGAAPPGRGRRRPWTPRSPPTSRGSPTGRRRGRQWPSATRHLVDVRPAVPGPRARAAGRLLVALSWMLQTGDAATAATFTERAARPSRRPAARQRAGHAGDGARRPGRGGGDVRQRVEAARCGLVGTDDEVAATIALQSAVHHFGRLDGARRPSSGACAPWSSPGPTSAVGRTARTYLAHGLGYLGRVAEAFAASTVGGAEGDAATPRSAGCSPARRGGCCGWSRTTWTARGRISPPSRHRAYELGVLNIAAFALRLPGPGRVPRRGLGRRRGARRTRRGRQRRGGLGLHLVDGGRHRRARARRAGRVGGGRGGAGRGRGPVSGGLRAVGRGRRDEPGPAGRGPRRRRGAGRRPRAGAVVPDPRRASTSPASGRGRTSTPRRWSASAGSRRPTRCCAPHEERAAERGRPSSIARLARARGRVEAAAGRPDRAEAAFERALDAAGRVRAAVRAGQGRAGGGGLPAPARAGAAGGGAAHERARPRSSGWARRPTPSAAAPSWPARACSPAPRDGGAAPAHLAGARRRPAGRGRADEPGDRRASWSSASRRSSTTCATPSRSSGSPGAGSWLPC